MVPSSKNKVSLFLDSGAHSLYVKLGMVKTLSGQKLSLMKGLGSTGKDNYAYAKTKEFRDYLDAYIKFVHENKDYLTTYVNLDVIGNADLTWENQKIMESHGLKPIPVYHFGENFKWLKMYVDKYDYVGIGGLGQGISKNDFIGMGDRVFSFICDTSNNLPRVKVHGFAMTSLDLMLRYPWYSVDSTSWVLTSRFGSVYVPRFKDGKYVYDKNTWKVSVSNRSPGMKDEGGAHFSTFSPNEQKIIMNYFTLKGFKVGKSEVQKVDKDYKLKTGERWLGKEEADSQRGVKGDRSGYVDKGFSQDLYVERVIEPGLCNDYRLRDQMNVIYFLDLEKSIPPWPWPFRAEGSSMKGLGLK